MSETKSSKPGEKAAKILRKPEQESVLSPTFSAFRQAGRGSRQPYPPSGNSLLQRQCACGTHTIGGGVCDACQKKGEGVSPGLPEELVITGAAPIQASPDRPRSAEFSAVPPRTIPPRSQTGGPTRRDR